MRINGDRLRYVLSAGRTGSAFLREYLKSWAADFDIAYEPTTSRRCWILFNMEQAGIVPRGVASRIACRRRRRDADNTDAEQVRLEINSFLSPFVLDLARITDRMRIVHVVRHPYTWIPSMGNFKAAYWRRHVIDYVPFTKAVHSLARQGWRDRNPIERLAWRWRAVNEDIAAARDANCDYRLIRYEDLVGDEPSIRHLTLLELINHVAPSQLAGIASVDWLTRVNPRPGGTIAEWQEWTPTIRHRVDEICGDLISRFGYDETPASNPTNAPTPELGALQ